MISCIPGNHPNGSPTSSPGQQICNCLRILKAQAIYFSPKTRQIRMSTPPAPNHIYFLPTTPTPPDTYANVTTQK
jgi:hypothetical protein